MDKEITFNVFRYKQGDTRPHYDSFKQTVNRWTTALLALMEIRRTQDPTLTLRHSCHHASCGTCGMKVNGQEVLACVTNVAALDSAEILVEPLDNLPIVSDLVVDMQPFYDKYSDADMTYVRRSEFIPEAENPLALLQDGPLGYTRYENCLECGLCVSACPVVGSDPLYLGPAAMAAAWRVVEEPRTGDPQVVLNWVDQEHGCWRCHVAFECSEVCPSNVNPGESIMQLRHALTRRKLRRFFGLERAAHKETAHG